MQREEHEQRPSHEQAWRVQNERRRVIRGGVGWRPEAGMVLGARQWGASPTQPGLLGL